MAIDGCPGSTEIRNPFPEELTCVFCNSPVEIWSDEPETKCDNCGKTVSREMQENCLLWCPSAKECVGAAKYNRLIKAMTKDEETTT